MHTVLLRLAGASVIATALGGPLIVQIPQAAQPGAGDRIAIRIIVVGTHDEATHVVHRLASGENFSALAREARSRSQRRRVA